MSLSIVVWKWKSPEGYRSKFDAMSVNKMKYMVDKYYHGDHRFICVTDNPKGIDPSVEIIPLWDEHGELQNPSGSNNPSCYRRLRMFSQDAEEMFGKRFVSLDLDCVITSDVSPLWNRPEDFVIWGDVNKTTHYNGSMILMTAGSRPQVWDDFHPIESPKLATRSGYFGSDQAWISYKLGPSEKMWTMNDGVYSYRRHLCNPPRQLPQNARLVIFHGRTDPWSPSIQNLSWIKKHYTDLALEPKVHSLNLTKRFVVLNDGRTLPIIHLFDIVGRETEDIEEVQSFVAGKDQEWFSGLISQY